MCHDWNNHAWSETAEGIFRSMFFLLARRVGHILGLDVWNDDRIWCCLSYRRLEAFGFILWPDFSSWSTACTADIYAAPKFDLDFLDEGSLIVKE